jgi:hypothetical protein
VDGAGAIGGSNLTDVNDAADDFRAFLAAADVSMQLLHSDATTPDEVTGWVCEGLLATQRRRLR